jgi:hypothetical protein
MLEFDGVSWKQVVLPAAISSLSGSLGDVKAFSASNVWAVGSYSTSPQALTRSLVLHWNGSTWARVTAPMPSGLIDGAGFGSIDGSSASAMYAVGWADFGQLVERWNGTVWSIVTGVPAVSPNQDQNMATDVRMFSPSSVWITVDSGVMGRPTHTPYILHWNGTAWSLSK